MFWGPILGAVGSAVIGGLFGQRGQSEANAANAAEAARNREFQAEQAAIQRDWQSQQLVENKSWMDTMSSTAYQRAVGDMKDAGLNPMLGYSQGGASSPNVAVPGGASVSGAQATIGNRALAAMQSAQAAANIAQTVQQTDKIEAEKDLVRAQTDRETASAGELKARTNLLVDGIEKQQREISEIIQRTHESVDRSRLINVQRELTELQKGVATSQIDLTEARTRVENVVKELRQQDVKIAEPLVKFSQSEFGEANPLLQQLMKILQTWSSFQRR